MLETEIKKLNETMTALTASIDALNTTVQGMGTPGVITTLEPPLKVEVDQTSTQVATEPPVADPTPPKAEDLEPIDRPGLSAILAGLAKKYGAPAQDAIKQIILETAGTQALSQVAEVQLPIILGKVRRYEEYMEASDRG